jgi:hypothetical protein
MAKRKTAPKVSAEQKKKLSRLKKRGLYKPKNTRKAPTRYGLSLLKKFSDVLTGKASVVTVKEKRRKGYKAAKKYAHGETKPGTVRVVRNKIIVPTSKGERATYSKKRGEILVSRKVGKEFFVRTPFPKSIHTINDVRSQLRPGDRISVPFNRGSRGVEWFNMPLDEFEAFWGEYGPHGSKRKYIGLADQIQIFRTETETQRKRIAASEKPSTPPKKKKPKKKKASPKKKTKKSTKRKSPRKRKLL